MRKFTLTVWCILTLPFFLFGALFGLICNGIEAGYGFMDTWINED